MILIMIIITIYSTLEQLLHLETLGLSFHQSISEAFEKVLEYYVCEWPFTHVSLDSQK
jgi:hypothetical protein